MKKILLMAWAFAPALVFAQNSAFTIKAKIAGAASPAKVYLLYRSDGKGVIDSALINEGSFQFKGTLNEPVKAQLIMAHQGEALAALGREADVISLYLEKGDINLVSKDSVKKAAITGSKLNDEDKKYKMLVAAPDKAMALVNSDYAAATADQKNDQSFMDLLQVRFDKAKGEKLILQQQYIKQNPASYLSLLAITEIGGPDIDVAVVEPLFKSLTVDVQHTLAGQAFAQAIESARATSVGAIAPQFTQNDVNDQPVSLASFRGKYLLLDFWASWCGPCRGENPNVVKAYARYKDKNFTVLGVSLDRPGKKEDWLAAIKADGLEWTQVSDLQFWNNEAAKKYGVRGIPQNYLIDTAGKIIAKNLRGDELNKKLAALFN